MNIFEKRSLNTYDRKADDYENTFDGKFSRAYKEQLLKTVVIPQGGRVLDIACGNGRLLKMLSETQAFAGYGVDISEKMVQNARRLNPAMTFDRAVCDQLPFEDLFFDVITVCVAFHHFPNVDAFARETARVLKPNGVIYIAEVYYPALIRGICNPFVRFSRAGDIKFYGPEEIAGLFRAQGFVDDVRQIQGNIQIVGARKMGDREDPGA